MNIFIKTLTGRTKSVLVEPTDTIEKIKLFIEESEGIPPNQQRLIFSGKLLEDKQSLEFYKILPNSTLNMVVSLRGG